jgi:hypothetical protein
MKYSYIILILILIIVLLTQTRWESINNYEKNMELKEISDVDFNTGDIILYRHDTPLLFYGENGINLDVHIVKNVLKTILHYNQKYYSHCGIVIKINKIPYILHLTADDQHDIYTNRYVIGLPSLVSIDELFRYKGIVYYSKYIGIPLSDISFLPEIFNNNIHLDGNLLNGILSNILKIKERDYNKLLCCDFVKLILFKLGICDNTKSCDLNEIAAIAHTEKYNKQIKIKTRVFKCLR